MFSEQIVRSTASPRASYGECSLGNYMIKSTLSSSVYQLLISPSLN